MDEVLRSFSSVARSVSIKQRHSLTMKWIIVGCESLDVLSLLKQPILLTKIWCDSEEKRYCFIHIALSDVGRFLSSLTLSWKLQVTGDQMKCDFTLITWVFFLHYWKHLGVCRYTTFFQHFNTEQLWFITRTIKMNNTHVKILSNS